MTELHLLEVRDTPQIYRSHHLDSDFLSHQVSHHLILSAIQILVLQHLVLPYMRDMVMVFYNLNGEVLALLKWKIKFYLVYMESAHHYHHYPNFTLILHLHLHIPLLLLQLLLLLHVLDLAILDHHMLRLSL